MDQPTPWRFSLRTLLGVTALVAVAYAPAGWLGTLYVISVTLSMLLLVAAWRGFTRRNARGFVTTCVLALVFGGVFFSSALFFQAASLLLVILGTQRLVERPQLRWGICAAVSFLVYLPLVMQAAASHRRIERLRADWPFVSIRVHLPESTSPPAMPARALTPQQEESLVARDDELFLDRWGSAGAMERLHSDTYRTFAISAGFGPARMAPVGNWHVERAARDREAIDVKDWPVGMASRSDAATPSDIHTEAELVFLDEDRTGYVQDLDHVAGFLGHGFSRLPYDDDWREHPEPRTGAWRLNRLDLIGLVMHEEPAAYVTDGLPNMEELRDATIRDLDEFETAALERLRGSEDVVVRETRVDGELRVLMLGAVRAGESCAACHQTSRGTLLGAFSYELTRTFDDPGADPAAAIDSEPPTSVGGEEPANALN